MLPTQMDAAEQLNHSREQLDKLRSGCGAMSAILREVSRDLRDSGLPPSANVIEQLRQLRTDFDNLQAAIGGQRATDGKDVSLSEMQESLDAQTIVQATLARLECFTLVRHVEQPEFVPWNQCLQDGAKLRQELLSAPAKQVRATAEQFLNVSAPLNAIVTLLAEGPELTDERWSLLLETVSTTYGREVSTAIARGKLVLMSGARA